MSFDGESTDSEIDGNHWGVEEDDPEVSVNDTSEDEHQSGGISPIVGVILMVAVTVMMAAIIGAFVLDLTSQTASDSAETPSVLVEKHPDNDTITVSITDIPSRYNTITVEGPSKSAKIRSERTFKFENSPDDAKIVVKGTYTESSGMYESGQTKTVLLYSAEITLEN